MSPNGSPQKKKSAPDLSGELREKRTYFLGRYRVVDEIGTGGMASVHLARMDGPGGFQKWVAIKRIHPHLVEDKTFVDMFLDEARIVARISHPNVATVFELGREQDTYWIAMEYLHGEPLREVMRKMDDEERPMPPEIACRLIADAAEGLHAAHELTGKNGERLELVHRDVTPHNLFITYDGATKVVDFGIAKFSSRVAHTRAGMLKGKIAYMSPEQVSGETLDRRTDIFALGVVLWELTTGKRLFRVDSDIDTLAKVQECNVPLPSEVVRGYPADLERIVMKALARNRAERYRTARELSRALQSLLMRRGVFVAADEVAAFIRSLFHERIEKRNAHLRRAAEVTQTLFVDDGSPSLQSFRAHEEDLSISHTSEGGPPSLTVGRVPRPAAGLPAADLAITSSNPTEQLIPRPRAATRSLPPDSQPTVPPPRFPPREYDSVELPDLFEGAIGDRDAAAAPTVGVRAVQPPPPPPPRPGSAAAGPPALPSVPPQVVLQRPRLEVLPQPGWTPAADDDGEDDAPTMVAQPMPRALFANPTSHPPQRAPSVPPPALAPTRTVRLDSRSDTTRSLMRYTMSDMARNVSAALLGAATCVLVAFAVWHLRGGSDAVGTSVAVARGPEVGPFAAVRSAFAASIQPAALPVVAPGHSVLPSVPPAVSAREAPREVSPSSLARAPTASPRPPAAANGALTVVCVPACDAIYSNGVELGASPVVALRVPAGKQRLRLVWPGAVTKEVDAFVSSDQTTVVRETRP